MKMYLISWRDHGQYCCKAIYGIDEARQFAKEISLRFETSQLEGADEWEHYRNGEFTW